MSDTSGGVSLIDAVRKYSLDRRKASRWYSLWLSIVELKRDASQGQIDDLAYLQVELLDDIRAKIVLGDLHLRGFQQGAFEEVMPACAWCKQAEFDLGANTASAFGSTLVGVQIYRRPPVPAREGAASAPLLSPAPSHVPRKSKGTAPATLLAIKALSIVFFEKGIQPTDKASTLAKLAAHRAAELGFDPHGVLNPEGSAMRDVASAFISGVFEANKNV